jgi:hypothetical protein
MELQGEISRMLGDFILFILFLIFVACLLLLGFAVNRVVQIVYHVQKAMRK